MATFTFQITRFWTDPAGNAWIEWRRDGFTYARSVVYTEINTATKLAQWILNQPADPRTDQPSLDGVYVATYTGTTVSGAVQTATAPIPIAGDLAAGNYTYHEADGTLVFTGNAMTFDDIRVEPVARTTGANAPAFEKYYDDAPGTSRGVYLYSFDDAAAGSEKEIFFTMQMPHAWAGTTIHMHVHWVGAVNDTTAEPRWALEYCWKNIGETFGDTAIVYANTKYPVDANVTAGKHYLTEFADITPDATQSGLSSILIGRIYRDSANAGDTYNAAGAKCGLLYIDAHYEINTIGSRLEFSK